MHPRDTFESPFHLLMTRRQVVTAFSLSLATPVVTFLSGCGGGGNRSGSRGSSDGSTTSLTLSAAKGRVVLPAGSPVRINTVTNLWGESIPSADGAFDFSQAAETPLLTMAYGSGGEPVLYGFLSDTNSELSARSTALVLACFVLGVGAYPAEVQTVYQDEIARARSLDLLESTVAAALSARGEAWLDPSDGALVAALTAVQAELSAHAPASVTRGVILDKSDRVSGLQVKADGISSLTVTNYYRRRAYIYVDRVSYKVKGTGESVDFKGLILPQPIKITPIKGVSNTLVNLAQLLGGQRDFYEPVTSSPISIPVNPGDAASTTYTATAVGIGVSPGDFDKLTPVQQDGWWEVTVLSMLLDLVAPVIAGVIIPAFNKDIENYAQFNGAGGPVKDIVNAIAASPEIKNKARSGRIADAAWDTLLLIVKSDTLKNVFLQSVGDFIQSTFKVAGPAPGPTFLLITDRAKFLANSGVKLLSFISKINVGLQVFDTVTTGFQLSYCNNADVFTLEVTNAIARLNPATAVAEPIQAAIPLTASVTNADAEPDTIFSYKWSCACKFGDISDGLHTNSTSGLTFDSSSDILSYIPNGKGVGGDTETVSVQIFKGPINKRVAVGTATSTLYIVQVSVTPEKKLLEADETVVLTADIKGAPPLKEGEKIDFRWTTTRNAGELLSSPDGGATIPVEGQTATYRAHATQQGTDTIAVEAFLGSTRLGGAKASMTIPASERKIKSILHYEQYTEADYIAANLRFQYVATGSVVSSIIFPLDAEYGYYLVRGAPDSKGQRLGYKITVADVLKAVSLTERTPPVRGAATISSTIVEPIAGYIPPNDLFRRRGSNIYFQYGAQEFPFYPSVTNRITDAAGTEAYMREHEGNVAGIEILWKSGQGL